MYEFAVVALLGLATLKVVDLLTELVPGLTPFRTLLTFTTAVAGVVALDYSVFGGFGIEVREAWIGTLVTGLIAGSLATAWSAVFGWLGGASEGRTPEKAGKERPRMAA
jgi:hypothetical protein